MIKVLAQIGACASGGMIGYSIVTDDPKMTVFAAVTAVLFIAVGVIQTLKEHKDV